MPAIDQPMIYPPPGDSRNSRLTRILRDARTRPVYAACFGDSQETASAWVGGFNSQLRRIYGRTPASHIGPLTTAGWEAGSLWCSAHANVYEDLPYPAGASFTASSGTTTTFVMPVSTAASTSDLFLNWWIGVTISGTTYYRQITDHDGTTRTITVDPALPVNITGSVTFYIADPRKLPPQVFGRMVNASAVTGGGRFKLLPDNLGSPDIAGRSYLAHDASAQAFVLPALPANLTSSHKVRLRVIYARRPVAGDATVTIKPSAGATVSVFDTTVATFTTPAATLTGTGFVAVTYDCPFAAGKPYQQAFITGPNDVAQPVAVVAARWEAIDGYGITVDSFSGGGYTVRWVLDRHGDLGDFFAAWQDYDFSIIKLGCNDLFGAARTPTQFKADCQELITYLRTIMGPRPIVFINDTTRVNGTAGQLTDYNLYADKIVELCDENDDVHFINSRRLMLEAGYGEGSEGNIVYRGQWSSATSYVTGDVVMNGPATASDGAGDWVAYQCVSNHSNQRPPNVTYWKSLLWNGGQSITSGDLKWVSGLGFFRALSSHTANTGANSPYSGYSFQHWAPVRRLLADDVHHFPDAGADLARIEATLLATFDSGFSNPLRRIRNRLN